ncbi:MAG: hypothetical protein LBK28_02055 [Propionibacteriaceae bacterium]|jgi:hypothetical protein|nr:hypothetical protein [Propionibacteriaceae bacterium]
MAVMVGLTACSGDQTNAAPAGRAAASTASCPDTPLATLIARDISGTQNSPDLTDRALTVVEAEIQQAVACAAKTSHGHVGLWLFATNTAQTATVLSRDITVDGATEIARQRKAARDGIAASLMAEVRRAYDQALADLPATASDVLSQFPLAVEQTKQLEQRTGEAWTLNFVVLTDGLASRPAELGDGALTTTAARQLATSLDPPWDTDHKAWSVSVVGVGRIAGDQQPPTEAIEALKAFYTTWLTDCAERLAVVTDYPGAGSGTAQDSAPAEQAAAATEHGRTQARRPTGQTSSSASAPTSKPPAPSPGRGVAVTGMRAVNR